MKITKIITSLPVAFWLVAISLVLIISLFIINYYRYQNNQSLFLSSAWISISPENDKAYLNFSISENEKNDFTQLFKNLGGFWDGEPIAIQANDNLRGYLQGLDKLRVGLKISPGGITFQSPTGSKLTGVPKRPTSLKTDFAGIIPENSLIFLEAPNLGYLSPNVYNDYSIDLEDTLSLSVYPVGSSLDFALIGNIKNQVILKNKLDKMQQVYLEASPSGTGPKYSFDNVIDTVKTTLLTLENKSTLVYGVVGDNFVITGSSDGFRQILRASQHRMGNLSQNPSFQKNQKVFSKKDFGLYVVFKEALFDEGKWSNLKLIISPDFKTTFFALKTLPEKIDSIGISFDQDQGVSGVINLRK